MQYQGGGTTPGRSRIITAIPTPGRSMSTGIPTPGSRPRSSASGQLHPNAALNGYDEMRALTDAIRANDPAAHRSNPSSVGLPSPSISDAGFNFTGGGTAVPRKSLGPRQSIARPSSRASTSSDPHKPVNGLRSKTPTSLGNAKFAPRSSLASNASSRASSYARPESRQSDVRSVGRSAQAAADQDRMQRKDWRVDDLVRFEKDGWEGVVRYVGQVGDKPRTFVGIELAQRFHGQGKNDGTVNGEEYFSCSPHCGIFVLPEKLSPSMAFPQRSASVASSRSSASVMSGRATPAGRSTIKGKAIAPVTPSAKKAPSLANGAVTPGASTATPGSRGAMWGSMTAKQLSSAKSGAGSSSAVTSPTQPTPRASNAHATTPGRNRISLGLHTTPKGRSSAVFGAAPPLPSMPPPSFPESPTRRGAMPPPASPTRRGHEKPLTPTLSQTSTDTYVDGFDIGATNGAHLDLQSLAAKSRAIQDKISRLTEGKKSPPSPGGLYASPTRNGNGAPGSPSASPSLLHLQQLQTDRLKGQVEALEQENAILRTSLENLERRESDGSGSAGEQENIRQRLQSLQNDHEGVLAQMALLRDQHSASGRTIQDRETTIDALTSSTVELKSQVAALQSSGREDENKIRELVATVTEKTELVHTLKEAVDVKASVEGEAAAAIKAKDVEIGLLEARVQRAMVELEEERRELGGQVNELRIAGQETIALYEERLAHHEARRYEMDDIVQELEAKLQQLNERPLSPNTVARQTNTATQIENESLKEQLTHLQQKMAQYEDQLDDMRATSEKDEEAINSRITRYRETEAGLRKELSEFTKEIEKLSKAEAIAKLRVAEVEEAFRENDAALENARAEVEGLRTELAGLEGIRQASELGVADRLADAAKRASNEKTGLTEELGSMKDALDQAQTEAREANEEADAATNRLVVVTKTADELRARIQSLEADREDLERSLRDETAKVQAERNRINELQSALDSADFHRPTTASSKDLHPHDTRRDSGLSNSSRMSKRSADPESEDNLRNQITGLKLINVELRKETSGLESQVKVLESELKIHQAEVQELRDAMSSLETTLQETIEREESALDAKDGKAPSNPADADPTDPAIVIKALKAEIDTLQKRLTELEKDHAKTVHALNKDILDLESLVEAKIYREDDLEREIERLNEKLSRRRSSRKTSGGEGRSPSRASILSVETKAPDEKDEDPVCEVCGERGHDLVACETLGFGSNSNNDSSVPSTSSTLTVAPQPAATETAELDHWCDNCEVLGDHVTDDCPHSDEVF